MTDFRFAEPGRILWLWAVVATLGLLVWMEFRRSNLLDTFLSPRMAERLARRPSLAKRLMRLGYLALAGIALILALMRPQWGISYEKLPQVGAQIMVCLDVSRSMLAEDVAPNRLDRAKAEINELLKLLDGDQVGLIAFAGKATVLCPLTTDFGFFRLILDEASPRTIGRGGTRLEEPIRKAVAGFGEAADLSRVVLLITDGDDLDSYPMEAAKEAREKGIRILTVGFGDESGSKIALTDPRTGLKSYINDTRGQPVVSRLNGELLREIALTTEGAYIPAGTGSLDLADIHATHIEPLLRAETEGTLERIQNEGFQWAIMASLVFLLLSLSTTVRPSAPRRQDADETARTWQAAKSARTSGKPSAATTAALALLAVATVTARPARAQDPTTATDADTNGPPAASSNDAAVVEAPKDTGDTEPLLGETLSELSPREIYNLAVGELHADAETAESQLELARAEAAADGELRYRAAFNLGWLAAEKGERLIDSDPHEALQQLRQAVDWYQRAVRLRPKSGDARYNLELVMRRAMALADALAERETGNLARRLDQLIHAQRETLSEASTLLGRYAGADRETLDAEQARQDFRRLGIKERQLLADTEAINEDVTARLAAAEQAANNANQPGSASANPPAPAPGSQDSWQPAVLQSAQGYLTEAAQRLAKARSQFKLREGKRAYRRAHLALEALKSARDQLREPGERLRMLLTEAQALLGQTSRVAATETRAAQPQTLPSWLDTELLAGTQQAILERTHEIASQLQLPDQLPPDPSGGGPTPAQLEDVKAAHTAITAAASNFSQALTELEGDQATPALPYQAEAIERLQAAIEYLIELRGSIELAYRDAARVEGTLRQWPQLNEEIDREQLRDLLQQLHTKNSARAERLSSKLTDQIAQITAPEPLGPQPITPQGTPEPLSPEQQQQADERARLEQATQLLAAAREHMHQLDQALPQLPLTAPPDIDASETDSAEDSESDADEAGDPPMVQPSPTESAAAQEAQQEAEAMLDRLADLRRLFYTIAEHLKETAQRQANVNDDTQALTMQQDPAEQTKQLGPLGQRQADVAETSQQIADALKELSQKPTDSMASQPPPLNSPQGQGTDPQNQAPVEQYREAGELVRDAVQQMEDAEQEMRAAEPALDSVRKSQDKALEKLAEALQLLQPPDQQQDQDDSQQDQQQQPDQGQKGQDSQPQPQQGMSAQQLLQLIRDREAQRRENQNKRAAARREPVEKDW